ncbi:hypothetical protein ACIOJD_20960 [Streptomyces sp. NPDC088116]|uniref:hypothetical protein n=1 Tax=Streptomyces sp. NPDC088116 TaxID=3365825 RepID=UPI0037F89BBE
MIASNSARQQGKDAAAPAPLFSAAPSKGLFDGSDLGEDSIRKPEQPKRYD